MRGTHLQGMHLVLEGGLSMEHIFHCTVYCPTDTFHVVDDQVGSSAVLQMVLVWRECVCVCGGGGGAEHHWQGQSYIGTDTVPVNRVLDQPTYTGSLYYYSQYSRDQMLSLLSSAAGQTTHNGTG